MSFYFTICCPSKCMIFIQYLTVRFEFLLLQSKTKKCYIYTGVEKDGFFYPLHVAAEAGHKELVLMLVKAGAAVNMTDDRCHLHWYKPTLHLIIQNGGWYSNYYIDILLQEAIQLRKSAMALRNTPSMSSMGSDLKQANDILAAQTDKVNTHLLIYFYSHYCCCNFIIISIHTVHIIEKTILGKDVIYECTYPYVYLHAYQHVFYVLPLETNRCILDLIKSFSLCEIRWAQRSGCRLL